MVYLPVLWLIFTINVVDDSNARPATSPVSPVEWRVYRKYTSVIAHPTVTTEVTKQTRTPDVPM